MLNVSQFSAFSEVFVRNQQKVESVLVILIFLFCSWSSFAAVTSSCVTCHTSEPMMKALHKPPPLPAGEGEG